MAVEKKYYKEHKRKVENMKRLIVQLPSIIMVCVCTLSIVGDNAQELTHGLDYPYYLTNYTQGWDTEKGPERIEFEFEDAQLINVIRYVEKQFNLTFILDDTLDPVPKGGKSALGTKVSFKTHNPLTRKQAWSIFLTFLDMAGLAPRPGPYEGSYRITTTDPKSNMSVYNDPLPTYIGVHPDQLPDNDFRVRYVYFVQNASMEVVRNIMDNMKSSQAPQLIPFPEMRGIMITDKAYNIKSLMRVVQELDTVNMPETLSVIKLKRTDATRVAQLYKDLVKEDDKQQQSLASRLLGSKREETVRYFPTGTRVIPEPRTNTLIILGTQSAIEKIETFISNEIDREVPVPFKPTHIYTLRHIQAEAAADILKKAVKFQPESDAAKAGGVRDGDQYIKPVSIVPEKEGNRLIITADYSDYHIIEDVLNKIDIEQPQVAIKVLLVNITLDDNKEAGSQIRSKDKGIDGLTSDNVEFQTTGVGDRTNIIQNTQATSGAQRLLGDLIQVAASSASIGSTFLTLGSDQFGVWGIFKLLSTYTQSNIISNPFLVTANKTQAKLTIGETRRVPESQVQGSATQTRSFQDLEANLEVTITPQISYEDFVTLEIEVTDNQFTSQRGDRNKRIVKNSVIMANNEILALGGIMRTTFNETESGIPLLKNIPGLGYLFKNKTKSHRRENLLILLTPEIIPAGNTHIPEKFTDSRTDDTKDIIENPNYTYLKQDPFHRWFFDDLSDEGVEKINDYTQREYKYVPFANGETNGTRDTQSQPNKKKQGKQKLSSLLADKDGT